MIRCSIHGMAIALAVTLAVTSVTTAQSSAITYQGQLKDGGSPVNGTADLDFYIWDDPAGGNLVAGPDSHVSVPVTDGLFTVALDFGPPAAIFDGTPRWLEIVVNATPLSPRQELTAAPYAHFSALPWETSGTDISYTTGRVGIGSSTPNHQLRVSGGPFWTSNAWTGSIELDNAAAIGWQSNVAGRRFGIGQSGGGLYFFHTDSDPGSAGSPADYDMVINDSGNVGIGTTAPISPLTIEALGYGLVQSNGAVQVGSYADATTGWFGTRSNHPLSFFTNNSFQQATLSTAGNFGIGTASPARRVHASASDLFVARFESSNSSAAVTEFRSSSSNATWEYGVAGSAGALGLPAGSAYFYKQGNGTAAITMRPDNTTQVNGRLKCNILEVTGADLAEKFPSTDDAVEPGTVMEIDPDNAGQLRVCRQAYSSRVAGVVSGAGGLPAGAVLGNLEGHEDAPAIALSGRVWVRCDASNVAILPGDLLTTASTPGHAMKATDRDQSPGATLGKAMTELPEGTGLVLVLVSLQ